MRPMRYAAFAIACCALCCAPEQAADRGQALATEARFSPSPSNVFACTTCHSVAGLDQQATLRLPGFPLSGAASRPSFWGGGVRYLLDAVNHCYVDFMRGEKLSPDDIQGLELVAYLKSIAPQPEPARACTVVKNIDAAYLASLPPGDPRRGQGAYQTTCGYCHGQSHTGEGRIGPHISLIPDDTISTFGAQARTIVAEKARHGRYFGIVGNMPPYCVEALSDADLADILSYLFK